MPATRRIALLLATLPAISLLAAQPAPPTYVEVERSRWSRLDARRVDTTVRTTRARHVERLAVLLGATVAFDPALAGLADTVTLAGGLSLRRAMARALGGTTLTALVDSASSTIIIRRAGGGVRRVRVIDTRTQLPVVGAEVLVTRLSRSARTDRNGQAVLGAVGDGPLPITVRALGFVSVVDTLDTGDTEVVRLTRAAPRLTEVVVTPGTSRALESGVHVAQSLSREEVASRPQIGEDLFRAVNRLPGVAASDFSAGLNVRGARSDELLVMLDGMQLREPYHLKDIGSGLSILDVHATGGVDLVPGSFTSEYGERLTGVMSITSRPLAPGERLFSAGLSATWLRGLAGARTRDGRWSWLGSLRRGYLDLVLDLTNAEAPFAVGYGDGFVRGRWHASSRDVVTVSLLGSTDFTTQDVQFDAPPFRSRYGSRYGWTSWQHSGERLQGQTVVGLSQDVRRRNADGGTGQVSIGRIADRRELEVGSLRSSWTWAASHRVQVRFGTDVQRQGAAYDYGRIRPTSATLFGFERKADTVSAVIDTAGLWTGAWLAPRVQVGRLVAEVGGRVDRWSWRGPVAWQPRVNLAWQVDASTTVRAAAGSYAQPQALDGLPVEEGVREWAMPERARHLAIGVDRELPGRLAARVDVYQRTLTSVAPRYAQLLPDIDITRDLRFTSLRVDPTDGLARGVELSVASAGGGRFEWSGWYALSQIADRIGGRLVPRDVDQRHAASMDLSVRTTDRRWRGSLGIVMRQGWPLTPVGVRADTFVVDGRPRLLATPTYGAYNSERLPTYVRVDLRLFRRYQTRSGQWTVFADVFNLLGRQNPLGIAAAIQAVDPLQWRREPIAFVPRIPTAGLSWER